MIPEFLGRLHPLVLHIPIGVYVLLFLLQFVMRSLRDRDDIIHSILIIGALSAVVAAAFGWLLSLEGDHAGETLEWHRWLGVAFSVSCILLAVVHLFTVKGRIPRRIYHLIFIFNLLLMSAAGHYGGNLTHGEGYLFSTGASDVSKDRTPVDSSAIFHSMVMPVLESKCVSCHKADKTKGGLRMDEYARLVKGGKHGPVFVAGDPAQSEMLVRVGLPMDDEKHMPPAKKPQLTAAETALLHWWVLHGASVTMRIPSDASSNDTLRPFLKEAVPAVLTVMDTLPSVSMPDTPIIFKLKAAGWSVRPIAQGSPLLDVSAVNMGALTDKDVNALMPIAGNILWLDLSGMPVTDASMNIVAKCVHLRRLSLKRTRVGTDGIRKISALQSLQQLNLVNTSVDEEALSVLGSLPALNRVYAWQTRITPAAAEMFMKNSPRIRLETGYNVKP
jgi:mono/diheme cytochrome c family protein/uncharacterized membrane protein